MSPKKATACYSQLPHSRSARAGAEPDSVSGSAFEKKMLLPESAEAFSCLIQKRDAREEFPLHSEFDFVFYCNARVHGMLTPRCGLLSVSIGAGGHNSARALIFTGEAFP